MLQMLSLNALQIANSASKEIFSNGLHLLVERSLSLGQLLLVVVRTGALVDIEELVDVEQPPQLRRPRPWRSGSSLVHLWPVGLLPAGPAQPRGCGTASPPRPRLRAPPGLSGAATRPGG
eukprot:9146975-Pyramimonas_sp.AAC.1